MKRRIAIATSLLAAACASGSGGGEGIVDFTAQVRPNPGYALNGSARAVASLGNTAITLEVQDGTPGSRHPWHVHSGTCSSGGPVVGAAAAYSVLEIDADGEERSVATIGVQLDDDTDYHVNVHLSPTQAGTIIACGDLVD